MTGRLATSTSPREAARAHPRACSGPTHLLVAEHGHDFRDDLGGGGWHGTMNYAGFLRPAWAWLRGDELPEELRRYFWGTPVGLPRLDGHAADGDDAGFRAGVPWQSMLHSWTLLDSHDTARFRTVAGSRELHEVGHRAADDDARRADGLRRRRARARGRLGRGRAPDDAVGPARDLGHDAPRDATGA